MTLQRQIALVLFLVVGFSSHIGQAERIPATSGSPLQQGSDAYMGDWRSTKGEGLVAQVIALGKGDYQANILEEFDRRGAQIAELTGRLEAGVVQFEGSGTKGTLFENTEWSAQMTENSFEGKYRGRAQGGFSLEKTVRLSPTLGLEPPAGAKVLFDGEDLSQWGRRQDNPHHLQLAEFLGGSHRVAYLKSRLFVPTARPMDLLIGSDDGVKVWLNGAQVHEFKAVRGARPGTDVVPIELAKGWNEILLKVVQVSGGWGAYANLQGREGSTFEDIRIAPRNNVADADESEAIPLSGPEGFLMEWGLSGPYVLEGVSEPTLDTLFDAKFAPEEGKSAEWVPMQTIEAGTKEPRWLVLDNGVAEVKGGSILTKEEFGDFRLHLEFRTPFMPEAREQARGNSGVYLHGKHEIQVLDSYGLRGADNECGGFYLVAEPRVNACAPPLQWQTYDIVYHAIKLDAAGKVTRMPRVTVDHNGVRIHDDLELPEYTAGAFTQERKSTGILFLQDHSDPVQYRNIWLEELK